MSEPLEPARIAVRHPGGAYEVVAGRSALAAAGEQLATLVARRAVFVVSSPRVLELHRDRLEPALASTARTAWLEVPDGEEAKSLEVAGGLWRRLLVEGGKRDSVVVAFGGGSVGDLAGFVAGAFLRGVAVVQIPTTLLAQVDASVGGKTAIDLPEGKNTVGVFHHPSLVIADTDLLATLPGAELRAGLIESIKMAFLLDPALLARIERDLPAILACEPAAIGPLVAASIAAKAGVVERDPSEHGERRLLNFGHTLAHALETVGGYASLRHGEAVGWGMLFALELAERLHGPIEGSSRLRSLLARCDLPRLSTRSVRELLELVARDKKATEGGVAWVLPAALGGARIETVDGATVRASLEDFLASS